MRTNKIILSLVFLTFVKIYSCEHMILPPVKASVTNIKDENAIMAAVKKGNLDLATQVLNRLSEPFSTKIVTGALLETITKCQEKSTGPELAKLLIKHGANPNYVYEIGKIVETFTPMHAAIVMAMKSGNVAILKTLLENGGDPLCKSKAPLNPFQMFCARSTQEPLKPLNEPIWSLLIKNIAQRSSESYEPKDITLRAKI